MALHIIIDGYNLIRQSPTFGPIDRQDMEQGREALIETLRAYKKVQSHRITVVFDAADAPVSETRRGTVKGIHVRFSRPGQSADAMIKNMAVKERERAVIVTSDRDIVDFSQMQGAAAISAADFEEKIMIASYMNAKGMDAANGESRGWTPTTRKKGPSRRLPKIKRRIQRKTEKL